MSSALSGAASVISILTTRRFGLGVQIRDEEAKAIARPVARLIQRRAKIRRDLDDAADGAGALAGFMNYIERVAAGSDRPSSPPTRPSPPPAPAPEATTPSRVPQHERVESFVDQSRPGTTEPGSGAFRETFLSGFEEVRPHP